MTIQQLYYAITIAECGSMNKASEKLFISQPTLTGAIKDLESEIGIKLFLRTHKGVTPTAEGGDFLERARSIYGQLRNLQERYADKSGLRRRFGVSTQHYSFAVKAFVEMAKHFDISEYEFAIYETETLNVINDVGRLKSELGILYMNNLNRRAITKLLGEHELVFHELIRCRAYVYLWKEHPLAKESSVSLEQLEPYPCLSFRQSGGDGSFFAEEILSENIYPRTIKASDRATMLNLMIGLNGYTLCSGIISEELNGDSCVVVPFRDDEQNPNSVMEIGYITKKYSVLSEMGERYIEEIKKYLSTVKNVKEEE